MSRPLAVLRPEPGNRVTAAAIEARGRRAIRLPLFAAQALAWEVPEPGDYDALILTSANAVRLGGAGIVQLLSLPVHAVGVATAAAARRAGFAIASVGEGGAATLLDQAAALGVRRALHLAGRARTVEAGGVVAAVRTVYASDPVPVATERLALLAGSVALIQSARAGARLAELVPDRATIALAAVSEAAAVAAGTGWERVAVAPSPASDALIETAIALAD